MTHRIELDRAGLFIVTRLSDNHVLYADGDIQAVFSYEVQCDSDEAAIQRGMEGAERLERGQQPMEPSREPALKQAV